MFSADVLLVNHVFPPKNGPVPSAAGRYAAKRRRGIAILFVMLLLAMTLALSYAAVRTQGTALQIQWNSERSGSATQTAMTGMMMALKKMQTSTWAGPGTTLSGSLSSTDQFQVSYTFGDSSLTTGRSNYWEYPYRMTLVSTGSSTDSFNPQCVSTHQIRAVVRLVPRQLAPAPTGWSTMQNYTLYQTTTGDSVNLDIPCRVEGPVCVNGILNIAPDYPTNSNAYQRYLTDLNAMQVANQGDYRPLSGPVDLTSSRQSGGDLTALRSYLGVTGNSAVSAATGSDWANVSAPTGYQVHHWGPVYNVPTVGTTLTGTTLGPDPLNNPLGIYYRNGDLTIGNNVTIQGTLFCKGNINVTGTNVCFSPVEMPALYGAQGTTRLPAVTCQTFDYKATALATFTGLMAAFNQFVIDKSADTVAFPMVGRVIARSFTINSRTPWDALNGGVTNWGTYYQWFMTQLGSPNSIAYFPQYMGQPSYLGLFGRNPQPRITLKPDPTAVAYTWYNPYYPVFVPNPSDADLRWEIVTWSE